MSNKSKKSLADLLRKWVARGSRVPAPRPTAKLRLEEVEHRVVPATTPGVTTTAQIAVPNAGGGFTPQVVVDPTNPNTLAMVVAQPNGILAQVSFDGGVSWTKLRDTNSPFSTNPTTSNVPQTFQGDASRGMLIDPTRPINAGLTRDQRAYTDASEPTIAFTRSGSVYIVYMQHNADKTSGALLVERFDINRAAETFTYVDLDRPRDWDDVPATPASERWETAVLTDGNGNLDNRAYVLYQWVDNGATVNRPANPYIGVDTNLGTYTDPTSLETIRDPFVAAGGGDTIFVAWNMISSAPAIGSNVTVNAVQDLGYVPNAVMLAVGRVDPVALIDRPDPNAAVSASNPRQAAFLFSTPVPVNDGGFRLGSGNTGAATNTGGVAPVISFNPATMQNGTLTPGTLNVTWGTAGARVIQSSLPLSTGGGPLDTAVPVSASYTFRSNDNPDSTAGSNFIQDAFAAVSPATFDTPQTSTFELRNVNLTPFTAVNGGDFTTLDDLDVTIALSHPNLNHLQVQLISPDNIAITLVRNRTAGDNSTRTSGQGVTFGLTGADLGVAAGIQGNTGFQPQAFPGNPVGTVFSDEAARFIHDPNNPGNYIGSYRPETGSLATFYGRTAAQLNSASGSFWRLAITDFRADRLTVNNNPVAPIQLLQNWSLTFTSRLDNSNAGGRLGTDNFISAGAPVQTVPMTNLPTSTTGALGGDQTFSTLAGVSPTFGVGAGVSVAVDNSLGSYSPNAGRMYLVYTGGTGVNTATLAGGNTNIFLLASDTGGATWFRPMGVDLQGRPIPINDDTAGDNFSEGNRTQYQPTVTVDAATGMVVVSWFDARTDASNTRVATFVATSIDGGASFSPARSVNSQKTAIDAITGRTVTLEPVPTNVGAMPTYNAGAYQYGGTGVRQSLVAYGGVIKPFWSGNLNAGGAGIFTANVRSAAGPRVVESDLGAVSGRSATGADDGSALILDENGFQPLSFIDAFGNFRLSYNDSFAPDGTRRIDGFRVVFDRPILYGTGTSQANATPSVLGFATADDVEVRYRAPTGLLDTATQGALVPVRGIRPIGGFGETNGQYFATAFFVQFETPQTAVGTYSYAIDPDVTDNIQSQTSAVFGSADTPVVLADPGVIESQIVIPPVTDVGGNPLTVADLQVGLNISHTFLSDLIVTLVGPDPDGAGPLLPTELILVNQEGGSQDNIINMRISDNADVLNQSPYPFQPAPNFNNFNDIYAPFELNDPFNPRGLSAFAGQLVSGTWTLRIEDVFATDSGTLNAWTLKFRDANGNPQTITRLGNGLDQDADGNQREPEQDVFTVPGSLAGAPFTGPFDPASRPLVAPGAHVVRTYAGGQAATAVSAAPSAASVFFLDVTLDREVDVNTLTLAGIATVVGPSGPLTPTSIFPVNAVNQGTTTFQLGFDSPLAAGSYLVALNSRVFTVDDTALNSTIREVFVRFDRDIDPASFTPANVLRITGPIGGVSMAGVTVTAVDDARAPLAAGAPAARLFRVTFDQPQLIVDVVAPQTQIPVTLTAVPTVGPLTLANVRLTGPDAPISLIGATLSGSGTNYTLTLAAALPVGRYTLDLTATPNTITRTQNNSFTSIPLTLAAAPPNGDLTLADITRVTNRVTGVTTNVSLSGATLSGGGTSYVLTFPAVQVPGDYTIELSPAALRGVAVAGSGVRLSGPYAIEFGSNPREANDALAAIRGADRAQAVVVGPESAANPNALLVSVRSTNGNAVTTLTAADVLRVTGPTGPLGAPTVTQVSQTTVGGVTTVTYRLTFAANIPAGQYTVDFATPATTSTTVAPAPTASLTFTVAAARTLGLGDILGLTGPNGRVDLTGATLSGSGDTYTLTFPTTQANPTPLAAGSYTLDVAPAAVRSIRVVGSGLALDNNFNAGVDLATGRSSTGAAVVPRVFASTAQPVAIVPATPAPTPDRPDGVETTTAEMAIVVAEDFVITQDQLNKIQVLLNVNYPDVWKLRLELVPPAASQLDPILLYNGADDRPVNAPPAQSGGANFRNTRLLDVVGDTNFPPVLDGTAPFGSTFGYTPQTPLSVLADPTRPISAKGTWVLRVTNSGTASVSGTAAQITNWTLTLPRAVPQSGLGERVADRFQAGFRVFVTDATNELSRDAWTPVSGSSNETANAGRVTAVAVDPSDPSGNTVYVAGASGGVWKTTNFLTNDIDGPHYVPLTDFGPTTAIHVQSLAVFPQNNDPSQTIVFALTGEGNTSTGLPATSELSDRGRTATGVGILRSADGGKTWAVLDSTDNESTDPSANPGTVGKVSDPGRDRLFVGTSGFKVVVDPNRTPEGGVLVYMALSGGTAGADGVWRSRDGGLTWERVRAGAATDVVLAAGSAVTFDPFSQQTITNGNLQRLYASFRNEGVFLTDSAPSAVSLTLMQGNQTGNLPNVRDVLPFPNPGSVTPTGGYVVNTPVQAGNLNPNGGQGRIAIAAPALTNDPLRNFFYKDWLYAIVVTPAGGVSGLYQTKDAGQNWTRVRVPIIPGGGNATNNETRADYDLFDAPIFSQGNYDIAISVDPLNPAVIYLSGVGIGTGATGDLPTGIGSGSLVGGSMRIDLTKIKDTQNFVNFNNSDPAGGVQFATTGGFSVRYPANIVNGLLFRGFTGNVYITDFINASRDPNNPFTTNSTLQVANVQSMTNDGTDVFWEPFGAITPGLLRDAATTERTGLSDIHQVFPFLDPVTGLTRFIYAGDQGVYTGALGADGFFTGASGFDRQVFGSRNGNLQLTQVVSGAVQPSQVAADVAGALFYAMAQDNGFLVSDPRAVSNGNANWRGPAGDGAWVEVDPLGSGRSYQYRSPTDYGIDGYVASNPITGGLPQEFLREFIPNRSSGEPAFGGGEPRTNGLIQSGDFSLGAGQSPGPNFGNQWTTQGGVGFAINPINSNALVIQSTAGRVFRSTTGGQSWLEIGAPGVFGNAAPGALAFGAFNSGNPSLENNFIYVGTANGTVFSTLTGGGAAGTSWLNISAGLDGSPVRRIVPNPASPSREVYVVTDRGVYYKADGSAAGAWTNITGNLFGLTRAAFGDTQDQVTVLPAAGAGRALNTLAVDWRFSNPTTTTGAPATAPDLYVGGVGGVFKSSDFGVTWRVFPSIAQEGATSDGGYLPQVEVTDLDLSIGELTRSGGTYEPGGLNLLLASTYGRGSWAIRLSDDLPPTAFVKGPAVTAVSIPVQPATTTAGRISTLEVQFNAAVDESTLRTENFRLEVLNAAGVPTGVVVPVLAVAPVAGTPNRYQLTFPEQVSSATQQYRLTVGFNPNGSQVPTITDPSGNRMNQNNDTQNGQPGPSPQGDQYVQQLILDAVSDRLNALGFPANLVAGQIGAVTIEQLNPNGTRDTSATGPLMLSTTGPGTVQIFSDPNGTTPITNPQLVAGAVTFYIRMTQTDGNPTVPTAYPITVTRVGSTVNPTGFTTNVAPGVADTAQLLPASQPATSGAQVTITIAFRDAFGNPTNYAGLATITYGGAAVGAASETSKPIDTLAGANTFSVTTQQSGTATVTASVPRPGGGTIVSTTASITVGTGTGTTVTITPVNAGPFVAGTPVTFTATVTDANGNVVNANGPLTVTPGGGATVTPASPTLTNGQATFTITYGAAGTYFVTVSSGALTGTSGPITVSAVPPRPTPTAGLTGIYAAATDKSVRDQFGNVIQEGSPLVNVYNPDGTGRTQLLPFPPGFAGEVDAASPGFTGGIRLSVADVTGDGVPDYVIGSGPTITATVLVVNGATNRTILTLRPFADFKGGVFVSTGDLTGDGLADIVITPDEGGGPRVTIIKGGTFTQVSNFFGIDDPNFRGGARAAMGDVNGDGFADLVVSAGFGGGPRISIYDGAALAGGARLNVIGDFFLFEEALRNGAYVAVGDTNGDGFADLIGGAGPGGAPRVLILDAKTILERGSQVALTAPLFNGFLGDINNRGGVRVAAKNLNNDRFTDLLIGSGEGGGSRVEAYLGDAFGLAQSFDLLPGFTGGVFVG